MRIIIPLLLALALLAAPAATAQEQPSKADELISKLSGFDFAAIKSAAGELLKLGRSAVPALLKALENQDPGIRKEA
ncbi:MAG: hypothetical protein NTV79_04690, partial [Candidatus Aureabacteria bacterium]|nr:hypothetical protein [Candidatus Auribacterota bacterium]